MDQPSVEEATRLGGLFIKRAIEWAGGRIVEESVSAAIDHDTEFRLERQEQLVLM